MKKRDRNRYTTMAMINVTNLVDISLVLLVIFILTAPVIKEGIDVDTPEARASDTLENLADPILVTVAGKEQVYINDLLCPENEVGLWVRSEYDKDDTRAVLLKGDKAVEYGYIMEIMDKIRLAGIKKVSLVTKNPKGTGDTDLSS